MSHVRYICELIKDTDKKIIYPNTNSGYGIGGMVFVPKIAR